jgi:hypothetical protein
MAKIERFEDIEAWKRARQMTRKIYAFSRVHFLAMAKASSGDVRSQLYVALDEGYITQDQFDDLYNDAAAVSKMAAGFIEYLQRANWRGNKFRKPQADPELET